MKDLKKSILLGLGLFAMFFGAGNAFLPSYIGVRVGTGLYLSIIGFAITAVGLPLLGLMVVIQNEGNYLKLFEPMGQIFSKIYLLLTFLIIGPIIAMPRIASTTYEMGVSPLFPYAGKLLVSFVFFAICILFSINKNKVVERVGGYLTPILIATLVLLIISGLVYKDTKVLESSVKNPFIFSFMEGYNTLDAIASIVFAKLIYDAVKSEKNRLKISKRACLIAAMCLTLVYAGLIFLGNRIFIENGIEKARTILILDITKKLLGDFGIIILAIIVILACLTTAIGLISAVSNYFVELFEYKISYNVFVFIITIVAFSISHLSVDMIISLSIPILSIFYPVLIVILILNLLKSKYINSNVIKFCTYTTLVLAIINQIKNFV